MINKLNQSIRHIRQLRNLTQDDMAQKLYISSKAYSKIESGGTRLHMKRVEEIAVVLDLSVEELMRFNKEEVFNHCKEVLNYNNTVLRNGFENERRLYEELISELKEQLVYWKSKVKEV